MVNPEKTRDFNPPIIHYTSTRVNVNLKKFNRPGLIFNSIKIKINLAPFIGFYFCWLNLLYFWKLLIHSSGNQRIRIFCRSIYPVSKDPRLNILFIVISADCCETIHFLLTLCYFYYTRLYPFLTSDQPQIKHPMVYPNSDYTNEDFPRVVV